MPELTMRPVTAATPALFVGQLSAGQQTRVFGGALPGTLAEKGVPLLRVGAERFRPQTFLEANADYTLAIEPGSFHYLRVLEQAQMRLGVVWPKPVGLSGEAEALPQSPEDLGVEARFLVFCTLGGEESAALPSTDAEGQLPYGVRLYRIPVRPDCMGLAAGPGVWALTPRRLFGRLLEPRWLTGTRQSPSRAPNGLVCRADEFQLLLGCARVLDDRMLLRGPRDVFWLISGQLAYSGQTEPDQYVVLRGLSPQGRATLQLSLFSRSGVVLNGQVDVVAGAYRPHLVLSEVMANPSGAEPRQEWVELYNDGSKALNLEGWTIGDAGGRFKLPNFELSPGEYCVVVGEDFQLSEEPLLVPEQNTVLLRIPRIGQSGLSNHGEAVTLKDPTARVASRIPAFGTSNGVSIARLTPELLDDDLSAFGPHKPPGGSPGTRNSVVLGE